MKRYIYIYFLLMVTILSSNQIFAKNIVDDTKAHCPDTTVKFLIAGQQADKGDNLASGEHAIKEIYLAAVHKYGENSVKELLGDDDSLQNFENYLACPNLTGVYSLASHEEQGQSFMLVGKDIFSYKFLQNTDLFHFSKAVITFDTCYAYKDIEPGLCHSMNMLMPKAYSGGVTPLPFFGAPETYTCFWKKVLNENVFPDNKLLTQCAQDNDPYVENSHSPLYLVGYHDFNLSDEPWMPFIVTTTLNKSYAIAATDQYVRLKLAPNESIKTVTTKVDGAELNCKANDALFYQQGLNAAEFALFVSDDNKSCEIRWMAGKNLFAGSGGYDKYGISPEQCGT